MHHSIGSLPESDSSETSLPLRRSVFRWLKLSFLVIKILFLVIRYITHSIFFACTASKSRNCTQCAHTHHKFWISRFSSISQRYQFNDFFSIFFNFYLQTSLVLAFFPYPHYDDAETRFLFLKYNVERMYHGKGNKV